MLTATQIALLEAIKASLFETVPNYPEKTDWGEVIKEAKDHAVIGLISSVIPVKDETTEMGKAIYMRILYEQDKLIKLLDDNDVPCVILKGCAAAQYYPKPYLRTMGDIDFLVPRNKFEKAAEVMESNGYKYEHGKDDHGKRLENGRHFGYSKNGISFELHHHFSSAGYNIDDILENAIGSRVYRKLNGYRVPMLPDIENGLVLLGHINQHLKESNLGLRQIIDWEMYVHKVLDDKTWNSTFEPLVNQIGLEKLSVITTKMCKSFLGLPNKITWCESADKKSAEQLLTIILSNGNFGHKRNTTRSEGRIQVAVYEIKHKGVHTFLKELGLRKSKACRCSSILSHFAWLYGLTLFIGMGIKAVVKTKNVRKRVTDANDRLEMLEELGLRN